MLDNTPNQPSMLRKKNWVEINNDACGTYNIISQIKFKTKMLKSSLYDYSDAYVLVQGTITITTGPPATDAVTERTDERNKRVIFKNYAPFTDWISEINNAQVDDAKDLDVVIPMYKLIEYSDNYSKTPESLLQYYRNEPHDAAILNFESLKPQTQYNNTTTTTTTTNNNNRKSPC